MAVLYSQNGVIIKPTNNVLPEGFKRIEYIDNPTTNGKGFFQIHFQKYIYQIEKIEIECSQNANSGTFLFSGYIQRNDQYSRFIIQNTSDNSKIAFMKGTTSNQTIYPSSFVKNDKYSVVYENNRLTLTDKNGLSFSTNIINDDNYWIDKFVLCSEISNQNNFFNGKIYSIKIKTTDNEEINSYPVKNSNGLVGFFVEQRNMCLVSEWDANNGLVAGPEI